MVELTPSFELDFHPIDNDHRRLVAQLNDIMRALDAGDFDACARLVLDFVGSARKHFRREEALLEQVGYPEAEDHHDHHRELDEKLETILRLSQSVADSKVARQSLRKELTFFVMDDVINADLDFKPYLAERSPTGDGK